MDWCSLHTHSTYSFLDGFGQPGEHMARAAELGIPAVFFTEHGNVSSHVRAEQAAAKYGVKAGFGLEAYTASGKDGRYKWHLGILARNATGYSNLMKMVTRSWVRGDDGDYYYEPTVSGASLAEHRKGLAVLSGCSGSLLACTLLGGKGQEEHRADVPAAMEVAKRFHNLLGRNYYLEVQAFPELDRTRAINAAYETIGRKLGIPLVATCDVHYPLPTHNKMQVLLHATGRGNVTADRQEQTWEYDIPLTYPQSDQALWTKLVKSGLGRIAANQAIGNAAELASRCNVVLPKAPPLEYPGTDDPWLLLRQWISDGFAARGVSGESYRVRIGRELELIREKGFVNFFLITADAVQWAKRQGIAVGPARGSAAASLVCYLLRITEINPLLYPAMMLERFLDPSRSDMPDIDLDFDDERRDELRVYLTSKYGEENVGNVQNFVRFRGKSSVNAAAHAAEIPKAVAEGINDLLIERTDGDGRQFDTVQDSIDTIPAVRASFDTYPELLKAVPLEGNLRGASVHAAGLIVGTRPLTASAALYQMESGTGNRRRVVSLLSLDKYDAEYLGFLKMDALGLTTMGMISRACELAGLELAELYAVPDDDQLTMEGFQDNDVTGIFQFEGRATRAICAQVVPETFMELADINALSRPGPLNSGTTKAYIAAGRAKSRPSGEHLCHARDCPVAVDPSMLMCGKHWKMVPSQLQKDVWATYRRGQEITKDPSGTYIEAARAAIEAVAAKEGPRLSPMEAITRETRGQIVYQEQILRVATDIGGFGWPEASRLRKIIGKKLGKAQFNELFSQFAQGAEELHGIDETGSKKIWDRLVTSAAYAFNIAHSVSYAKLAIWSMYLKQHYPAEFFTASLQKADDKEITARLLRDSTAGSRDGTISVGRPAVGDCGVTWSLQGATITPGYTQIPGIGEETAKSIIAYEPPEQGSMAWWLAIPGVGPKLAERIFSEYRGSTTEIAELQEIPGVGPKLAATIAAFSFPPMEGWDDLTQIKGVGEQTALTIKQFVAAEDPFKLWEARRFASSIKSAGLPGVPLPTHTSAQLDGSEGKCVWAGLISKVVYRDLAEDERAAGNPEMKGVKAPKLTRSVTLKCYDDGDDEVYLRIDRFSYRRFARQISRITAGSDGVVATGRIVKGFGASIRVTKMWIIEPD